MEIKIENYLSQEEIKEIIKDKISNYIDSDIKNTIEIAIKYSFFELLPKNYIDELPKIVDEKLKDITISDFIGYPPSDYTTYREQNIEARRVINQAVKNNADKIAGILLEKVRSLEDYEVKEIIIASLSNKANPLSQ